MKYRDEILARARSHEKPMVRFLRQLIAIPSESGQEGEAIDRIRKEMERVDAFDSVHVDPMGNLLGRIGRGAKVIAMDAHVDTVGVGDPEEWLHDPYRGKVDGGKIYGRGAGDQEGAVASMVYAARIIKDLGLCTDDWTLYMCFTVSEEDCDGLCWQYIIKEGGLRPDCVVITDSTNCQVYRGQRGRMEIGITVTGRSCHGSMPEKGDNAVYKVARIIGEIEKLNGRLKSDRFLGKGTVAVTYVDCRTPSVCAVPDRAYLQLDRRLTRGETKASALSGVRKAVTRAGVKARVEVLRYAKPSYTGLTYEAEKYFPTWVVPKDAAQVEAAVGTYRLLFGRSPKVRCWTFSTNGVSIAGMFGIPCVGFGPASEAVAHTVKDCVPIRHLVQSAAFYAAFPQVYCDLQLGR
jgi:putative selenium metabolism hydrolase